jgi:threonyl-tRNA synthetase
MAARGQVGEEFADVVAVRVGKEIVDLLTPIAVDSTFTPIRATEPAGLEVIRHSTAHIMADAVQRLFPGTKVTFGPAVEDGFYYDFFRPEGGAFTDADLTKIEKTMRDIVKRNSRFKREIVSRDQALELFNKMGETFKAEHIGNIPEGEDISLYRHGGISNGKNDEWVDLCAGPHVPSTGFLKAVKLTHVAGAYWRGDERNPQLQRIYGTAFATQEELDAYFVQLEEAKARDHRKLGKELDLFLFDEVAPAMPFFLPKGAYVYHQLIGYIRSLYEKYGYEEVITPQAFDPKLFRTSGHLGNYNENMYRLWTEDAFDADLSKVDAAKVRADLAESTFALKPMNCPSHCVIFGSRRRSYRELPWRVADFGRLHRYERGGVVHGLSRVRSFCQDDAHIFCRADQVAEEIEAFIKLLYEVYQTFQFTDISIKLALRPEKRIGSDEEWDRSEGALREGLQQAGLSFEELEGEGAFYGPKIEFHVKDALKRSWQLGTIQFDPNLPERFDLSYIGDDGQKHRPVMLHRAILGSLERFFSVYLEHCAGNFPAWIAPKQAIVLSVSEKTEDYARAVRKRLQAEGFRVDEDLSPDKLGAKIRNGRLARYPFLCVVGAKEAETDSVGVRSRERGELGAMTVGAFAAMLRAEASPPGSGSPTLLTPPVVSLSG